MTISSISNVGPHAASLEALQSCTSKAVCSDSVSPDFSKVLRAGGHDQVSKGDGSFESKLAGMLLGNLFQLMMPKETGSLFGSSSTAGMWSSFFSDAVADKVSQSGKMDLRIDLS